MLVTKQYKATENLEQTEIKKKINPNKNKDLLHHHLNLFFPLIITVEHSGMQMSREKFWF